MTQTAAAAEIVKTNPSTRTEMYRFSEPSDEDLAQVFEHAKAAKEKIARMSVQDRVAETLKLRDFIVANKDAIVAKLCAETGKSLTDALIGDVFTVLDVIDHYRTQAPKLLADEKVKTPLMLMGKKSKIMYTPLGIALIISPWNYPLSTALTPGISAFLAGNAVILKPSEETPTKGLLDWIIEGSGFLKDGMQVVFGGKDSGRKLIELRPDKVFFTGSVRAGKQIMEQASRQLISVELELGGKDPMLVFDDANLERAANGAVWGALNNSGQGCTSVERCFVQAGVYDAFVAKLKEKFAKLSTINTFKGTDEGNLDLGAITTSFQMKIIHAQVEDARAKGAEVWSAKAYSDGCTCYPPTVITNVNNQMTVQTDETFGPVITVAPFKTEEDAVRLANDTIYGLSSSVWTSDLAKGDRVARRIEAGNVCINDVMVTEGNSALPFGGVKDSGIGRYKGRIGLHNFCNVKSIMIDKGKKNSEANWYPYTREKYQVLLKVVDALFGQGGAAGLVKAGLCGMKLDGLVKKQRI
jgi:acyl-CoA reductase-like NAD-dependent aldehyde dehydrogenase